MERLAWPQIVHSSVQLEYTSVIEALTMVTWPNVIFFLASPFIHPGRKEGKGGTESVFIKMVGRVHWVCLECSWEKRGERWQWIPPGTNSWRRKKKLVSVSSVKVFMRIYFRTLCIPKTGNNLVGPHFMSKLVLMIRHVVSCFSFRFKFHQNRAENDKNVPFLANPWTNYHRAYKGGIASDNTTTMRPWSHPGN